MTLFKNRETLVCAILLALTLISWAMGSHHGGLSSNINIEASLIVAIAFIKVRLVIQHFMEVASAPFFLKLSCDAWVFLSAGLVIAFLCGYGQNLSW